MFEPRVALASLSGEADAGWARQASQHVGCAFLGGVAIDGPTREAARAMTERDRSEFLPDDPIAFVSRQVESLADVSLRPAFNVRSTSLDRTQAAAEVCEGHGAILEINAHCRQDELCAAGAGETLLRDTDRLAAHVRTAAETETSVSVKVRAEVTGVDLPALARELDQAGADCLHVDAMDAEPVVGEVVDACDCFVIANNGVRDRATAQEYLGYGADAVSIGRASDDPAVLAAVSAATSEWFSREVTP